MASPALLCFMPWEGPQRRRRVILYQRLVQNDVLPRSHIEGARGRRADTNLGPEGSLGTSANVATRSALIMTSGGIIRIGAEVVRATIWSAKVTPKARRADPRRIA